MANIHVHSDRSFREQQIKHEDEARLASLAASEAETAVEGEFL